MSANIAEARERLRKALYTDMTNEQVIMYALAEVLMGQSGSPSLIEELSVRAKDVVATPAEGE